LPCSRSTVAGAGESGDATDYALEREYGSPPRPRRANAISPERRQQRTFKVAGEALPDSGVAVMPGQRHAAMDTATDLFTAQVLSFLEARDRAR
jgi:hypothetical protein